MKKILIALVAGLAVIFTPIVITSVSNSRNYYLIEDDGALEVWKGNFAPVGRHHLVTMPGAVLPEQVKKSYDKAEVYPLICNYFIEKVDTIVDAASIPDFEAIRADLTKAQPYATTKQQQEIIAARFRNIDFVLLLYRADVAAGKGTVEGYQTAIADLESAAQLKLGEAETELVKKKLKKATAGLASVQPAPPKEAAQKEKAAAGGH